MSSESRPPLPPFTFETATQKVKAAQAAWNTKDPERVPFAYTEDTIWRNRHIFLTGREAVKVFLTAKWQREKKYKLRKELFAFTDNKIAVQFWYEYFSELEQQWFRCYGLEDWTFAPNGLMAKRQMSGNEIQIKEEERWFHENMTEDEVNAISQDIITAAHW
ncbi:DUF1348-domain-containing protein [Atractiella rhizophila]|nr:DUF1348-domain-containing protein [Atractiella rhizophila]